MRGQSCLGWNRQGITPQAVGTAGAQGGDAAGHHQDPARAPWQVGSPHTDPSPMALPAQPHTHEEPATPNPSLPSLLQV